MSDINDQGPQNLAQAEAESLRALEAGAWRVWRAGSGPLPAAYARWCATEIELATAALRERIEAAEEEHEDSVVRNNRALRERVEKAEAALAKMTGECERFCADYQIEYVRARKAEAEVARLKGLLEAKPYTPRVGDAFTWDGRHFIFSGPAEQAVPYVPRVGDVVLFDGEDAESAEKLPRIVTAVEPGGWWSCVHINKRGGVASGPFRLNSRISPPRLYRASTPAERAAAGLAPEAPAPAGPYVPLVGDVVAYCGDCAEGDDARVVTRIYGDHALVWYRKSGSRALLQTSLMTFMRPATPAERAAAGLEPVDAGLVGQHGELLKAAVAKEAPAQPQVIPGSLRGFPWDADWDKVIDGDAVIYGGRKITFRVEPFRADPHPAPAPADGSAAKFDEAIAAFDRARAEWREAIKQPQVLPEHLAYIEYLASNSCSTEARALRAAVARRDGGAR